MFKGINLPTQELKKQNPWKKVISCAVIASMLMIDVARAMEEMPEGTRTPPIQLSKSRSRSPSPAPRSSDEGEKEAHLETLKKEFVSTVDDSLMNLSRQLRQDYPQALRNQSNSPASQLAETQDLCLPLKLAQRPATPPSDDADLSPASRSPHSSESGSPDSTSLGSLTNSPAKQSSEEEHSSGQYSPSESGEEDEIFYDGEGSEGEDYKASSSWNDETGELWAVLPPGKKFRLQDMRLGGNEKGADERTPLFRGVGSIQDAEGASDKGDGINEEGDVGQGYVKLFPDWTNE
ncbi:MAG TPA: hypothetical protein VMW10_01820, partial [Alphaproteobacteria bacterium]|nr:hypothetical protein [Alphaproteobacteria bacterium]